MSSPPGGAALFQARRQVHSQTHQRPLALRHPSRHHQAGVHPDPHLETCEPVFALQFGGDLASRLQDLQPRADGHLGVVFASALKSEHRLETVSHEAQHLPTTGFDRRCQTLQGRVHDGQVLLGVQPLQ